MLDVDVCMATRGVASHGGWMTNQSFIIHKQMTPHSQVHLARLVYFFVCMATITSLGAFRMLPSPLIDGSREGHAVEEVHTGCR